MTLEWNRLPDGSAEIAAGRDWVYAVIGKPGAAVLTRWSVPRITAAGGALVAVASEAAVNAIPIHPKAGSGAVGSDLAVARTMAQDFEAGQSLFGHPAWQHESGS